MKSWIAGCALGLILSVSVLAAGTSSISGTVRGDGGKVMPGADVRLEGVSMKMAPVAGKTDSAGRYRFADLAPGTYKVTILSGATVRGFMDGVRVSGSKRLDFDIRPVTAGQPAKKAKHYVYVSDQTGTHIGGHWVEVNDSAPANDQRVDKMSPQALQRLQSRESNPFGN